MGAINCIRVFLIIITFLVFLAAMAINGLSALMMTYDSGLFETSTGNISDKYAVEITPAGWTFSIWGAIYIYQAIWMLYGVCTLCIKTDGGHLYHSPPLISAAVYFFYLINLCCNVAWLFTFDREYLDMALGFLAAVAFSLYLCMGITMYTLSKYGPELIEKGMRSQIVSVIALALNGWGMYAAWATIATLVNLAMVLTYDMDMDQSLASAISLGALTLVLVIYVSLDLALFERHFRYVYTPYIVLIVALVGSVDKNWDDTKHNSIFTAALLCCGGFLFLVKIIMSIVRSRTDPIYKAGESMGKKGSA